jgi:hypothetical protein
MNRKLYLIAVTILSVAAILLSASVAVAQTQRLTTGTIPYPGRLNDYLGLPVADGAYDFNFALYDAAEGGNLLWSESQSGVAVEGGMFTALLGRVNPIANETRSSGALWLAVEVRGPGEAEFTALTPRQALSGSQVNSVNNGAACAHDHFGETWTGTGLALNLSSDGAGGETLYVHTSGDHDGIRAYSYGTDSTSAGVVGINQSTGSGVYGRTTDGYGVYGKSTNGSAVVAENTTETGTALNIVQGAFKVSGAGVGTNTTVFIHEVVVGGANDNICPSAANATVIDNSLVNGNSNAILIVTLNGGIMGSVDAPTDPMIMVSYDANNMCGFGQRWLINNMSYNAMKDGTKFNVMVVIP